MHSLLLIVHIIIAVALVGVIAVQRSAAQGFGSGGGLGGAAFSGRAKADFITRLTTYMGAAFMVTSLSLAYVDARTSRHSAVDAIEGKAASVPAAPATPKQPEVPIAK